jgi:rhodanese-related sulfurtransferase
MINMVYTNIYNEQLVKMLEKPNDFQFVDVRTQGEYDYMRIPGFDICIDYYRFYYNHNMITHLDRDLPVIIMCNSGVRSIDAARIFYEEGFKEIYNLTAGIQGWDGIKI